MVNSPKIRHSKPNRDPLTIDLDARPDASAASAASEAGPVGPDPDRPLLDDIPPEAPAAASTSTSVHASSASSSDSGAATAMGSPAPRRGAGSLIAAGLVGGVIALAGAAALNAAGVLPAPGSAALSADVEGLRAELEAMREQVQAAPDAATPRLDELATALAQTRTDLEAMRTGAAQSAEAAGTVDERVKALETVITAVQTGGTPVDLAPVNGRLDTLEAAIDEARQAAAGASAPLEQRLSALEARLDDLDGKVREQAEQPNAALAIAASALKAAIDRGGPFMTEIETFASIAPQSTEVEALRGMAASGVPSATAIDADFPAAASAMIAAARPQEPDAGFLDRLMSSAQSLVQVRPVGMVEGEGVPAAVARMEVALQAGDTAAVIAEYERLPEAARTAGADFIAKVKARQAADGLIQSILAAALKA